MTDNRATQVSIEEFASPNPSAQVTQVTIEQWVATATVTRQALVTQVALEQWVPAIRPSVDFAGNLGTASVYGQFHYGVAHYSLGGPFAPLFAADIIVAAPNPVFFTGDFVPIVSFAATTLDITAPAGNFVGNLAPQIVLGGPLTVLNLDGVLSGSLPLSVVLGASSFVSGPLWEASAPVAPPWAPSEPCLLPPWMTTAPCDPVVWSKSRLCNG